MLLSRDAIGPAVETLSADQFYVPAHGYIFDAIASLYGAGEPADPVTVAEELTRSAYWIKSEGRNDFWSCRPERQPHQTPLVTHELSKNMHC